MFATSASAQYYPRSLRGRGWRGWGSGGGGNPVASYMMGAGYFNRATGEGDVKEAEASSLRAKAFTDWNNALAEARRAKEIREAPQKTEKIVEDKLRIRTARIESGASLNQALDRLVMFPSQETYTALLKIPLTSEVLRDLSFENASEPITTCLDVLTQRDGWPAIFKSNPFSDERAALAQAVDQALEEDLSGTISEETMAKLDEALSGLRSALQAEKDSGFPIGGVVDADQFLRILGGMIQMLEDPEGRSVIQQIETFQGGTMADLVGFMHAYNLRFSQARSDRQKAIYRQLYPMLSEVPAEASEPDAFTTKSLVDSSKEIGDAAKQIFSNLTWEDLSKSSTDDK